MWGGLRLVGTAHCFDYRNCSAILFAIESRGARVETLVNLVRMDARPAFNDATAEIRLFQFPCTRRHRAVGAKAGHFSPPDIQQSTAYYAYRWHLYFLLV